MGCQGRRSTMTVMRDLHSTPIKLPHRSAVISVLRLAITCRYESCWEPTMTRSRDYCSTGARADFSTVDRIEYVVRPRGDIWLIERDGDEYGPYKNGREALFFAIDA